MARRRDGTGLLGVWQEACEGGEDGLRRLVQHVIQEVLEEELTAFLGAESYERTGGRRGYRNGYKPRGLVTRVGKIELMVPKDREGRFRTELFERYQRSEKAFVLTIAQMYVEGVSTRKVKKVTEMLCGLEISRNQVSALAKGLDGQIAAWRNRPLSEKEYPYLVVDARYEKVRQGSQVVSRGVAVVVGVDEDGYREILGTYVSNTESEASWSEVFRDLSDRGLRGVLYVVSDDHKGLVRAIDRHFQGVVWQRCQVHFARNVMSMVRRCDRRWMLGLLRRITGSRTLEEAERQLKQAVESLETAYPKVAGLLEEHGHEILAVYALPESHRTPMRTTNTLERLNQELRRRTRVVRIFPDDRSCLRLVTALAMETSEEWSGRRYVQMPPDMTDERCLATASPRKKDKEDEEMAA